MYSTINTGILLLLSLEMTCSKTYLGILLKFLHILTNFSDTHDIYYTVRKVKNKIMKLTVICSVFEVTEFEVNLKVRLLPILPHPLA